MGIIESLLNYVKRIFTYIFRKSITDSNEIIEKYELNQQNGFALNLLERLKKRYKNYCLIKIGEKKEFYLINDFNLIKMIQNESNSFQSQLKQPYLIYLKGECILKVSNQEYEQYLKPIFKTYFKNIREYFINVIINQEFNTFISNYNSNIIQIDEIHSLLFNVSTSFLKYLFQIDKKMPNNKRLMSILFEMHSKFNLSLFTKTDNVEDYSKLFFEFLNIIYSDFDINSDDQSNNFQQIKFLYIKHVYLDTFKVLSCLVWILDDVTKLKLNKNNIEVRKYLTKLLTLDLFFLNKDYANRYKFFANKERLIVLNLYSVANNKNICAELLLSNYYYELFGNANGFVHTLIECLSNKFIKNFQFIKSKSYSIDSFMQLSLIRAKEIESFNVKKI